MEMTYVNMGTGKSAWHERGVRVDACKGLACREGLRA
jgi:hypothetical protein